MVSIVLSENAELGRRWWLAALKFHRKTNDTRLTEESVIAEAEAIINGAVAVEADAMLA